MWCDSESSVRKPQEISRKLEDVRNRFITVNVAFFEDNLMMFKYLDKNVLLPGI